MLSPATFQSLVDHHGVDGALAREEEYIAACAAGDAEAQRLSQLEPGPELAAQLIAVRKLVMDDKAKVLIHTCWEKQTAWTKAQQIAAMIDVLGDGCADQIRRVLPDLALQSRLSENSIGTKAATALQYTRLQRTWEAMNAGQLTDTHGWMMTTVTRNVPWDVAEQVDANVIDKAIAKRVTPSELGTAARLEVLKLDPEGAAERAEKAKELSSDVRLSPEEDEMARLCATGDAWTTRQMMDEINRRADEMQRNGDDRSVGRRRVGALAEAVLGEDVTRDEPTDEDELADPAPRTESVRRPKRATALLLVSLPTLLGGSGPANLDGYGPITAELARKIAASDVDFRRLVFDPLTGLPVEVGDRYEPPQPVRRWIDARDRTCLFPHCQMRAVFCDADHAVEFPEGKSTCANCGLLCRKHHNLKTDRLWKLQRNDDNSVDWESPLGFEYHREASTYEEFLDSPDPPGPAADHDVLVDDPDPPDVYDFSLAAIVPPPPQDNDDIEYDGIIARGEWRQVTPRVAKLIADAAA